MKGDKPMQLLQMQSHARNKDERARETNEKMVELSGRNTIGYTVLFLGIFGVL